MIEEKDYKYVALAYFIVGIFVALGEVKRLKEEEEEITVFLFMVLILFWPFVLMNNWKI